MKVSLIQFSATAPIRDRYHEGVDYLCHEFDLELKDTLYLFSELKNHRSRLSIQGPTSSVEFYLEGDGSVRSEIYGDNGLWADTQVDFEIAREILRMVYAGECFSNLVPTTEHEWDAYAPA